MFPVSPALRREYWDRLFSRLPLNEKERTAHDRFYECLLYSFRRDTAFLFEVNAAFLDSGKRKDRERSFSSRAMKWLAERSSLPPDAEVVALDNIPADLFGEGTPERELHGLLVRLKQFEEDRAVEEAGRTEDEWKAAAARLRDLLDNIGQPAVEVVRSAEKAAEAFLDVSRQYREEAATVERNRDCVRTALEAITGDERAMALLKLLETLDARGVAKLAKLAAQSSADTARMNDIAAETAAEEAGLARLDAEGASWAAKLSHVTVLAGLEAERETLGEGLSSVLDRMAAAAEPASDDGSVPASAQRRPKRRSGAKPAERKSSAPPEDRTGPQEERADPGIAMPATWKEFPTWCGEHLADRLILSPRARNTIKKTQYEDVGAAAKCLLWLADDYRRARLDGAGDDLRGPIESGLWNDRCGGDSFPFDWRGKRIEVEWHVKNGGNTTDPARCLRIYYFWDEADRRVVVASMPDHIPNGAV